MVRILDDVDHLTKAPGLIRAALSDRDFSRAVRLLGEAASKLEAEDIRGVRALRDLRNELANLCFGLEQTLMADMLSWVFGGRAPPKSTAASLGGCLVPCPVAGCRVPNPVSAPLQDLLWTFLPRPSGADRSRPSSSRARAPGATASINGSHMWRGGSCPVSR